MGAIGNWWRRRTRWQRFLVFLMIAGALYLAYWLIWAPADPVSSIFITDTVGDGEPELLTEGQEPAWSPDGALIAFTAEGEEGDEVHTIDLDGSESSFVAEGSEPAWSPDGSTLAFVVADEDDPPMIHTIGLDESDGVAVTEGDHPAWSPDGEALAFDLEMPNGETWVHLVELGDATVMTLTEGAKPVWSPDGRTLTFVLESGDVPEIYATDLESLNPAPVAQGDDPAWSADGVLAFSLDDEEGTIVYTMESDSSPVKITDGEQPSWSPDGLRVALVREE